jgi:hypothetical protein
MVKRHKRAIINDEQENDIIQFVRDFPTLPRTQLAEKIQTKVKWLGKPPEIEVLERKISHYRKELNKLSSKDPPWSIIGSLGDCSISPEALPAVLAVCKYAREAGNVFTVSQAKWAAKLSGLFRDQPPSKLWEWTIRYAGAELISQLLDRPLDTLSLDAQLIGIEADTWTKEHLEFRFRETALRLQEQLEEREQSRPKYPPAIWEIENPKEEQSINQSEAKKQKRHNGGKK